MFDRYILCDDGFTNVEENGKISGFQLQTRLAYYRGIPLSMVNDIIVTVDGVKYERSKVRFSTGEEYFTLDEMLTIASEKWEFGDKVKVIIEKENGLNKGPHEVSIVQVIRVAYYPFPIEGRRTKTLMLV